MRKEDAYLSVMVLFLVHLVNSVLIRDVLISVKELLVLEYHVLMDNVLVNAQIIKIVRNLKYVMLVHALTSVHLFSVLQV